MSDEITLTHTERKTLLKDILLLNRVVSTTNLFYCEGNKELEQFGRKEEAAITARIERVLRLTPKDSAEALTESINEVRSKTGLI